MAPNFTGGGFIHGIVVLLNVLAFGTVLFAYFVDEPLRDAWGCYENFQTGRDGFGYGSLEFGTCPAYDSNTRRVCTATYAEVGGIRVQSFATDKDCSTLPIANTIFDGPRRFCMIFLFSSLVTYIFFIPKRWNTYKMRLAEQILPTESSVAFDIIGDAYGDIKKNKAL